jgi:hypothetical protein
MPPKPHPDASPEEPSQCRSMSTSARPAIAAPKRSRSSPTPSSPSARTVAVCSSAPSPRRRSRSRAAGGTRTSTLPPSLRPQATPAARAVPLLRRAAEMQRQPRQHLPLPLLLLQQHPQALPPQKPDSLPRETGATSVSVPKRSGRMYRMAHLAASQPFPSRPALGYDAYHEVVTLAPQGRPFA